MDDDRHPLTQRSGVQGIPWIGTANFEIVGLNLEQAGPTMTAKTNIFNQAATIHTLCPGARLLL